MVGRRCLLERDIGDMRREVVFLILHAQNRWKTSNRSPWVGCTGSAKVWEMLVCERLLGSSCTAGHFPALVAEFLRASEVGMLKKILLFSRDLQDVS
jgi:hypothetical protein